MKRVILDILSSMLLGLGFIFLVSTPLYYWWVGADERRHEWVISGPPPFDMFGSGTFQLGMIGGTVLTGSSLILVSLVMRSRLRCMG